MNIGIVTMHRICNYGSFLQAYALKSIVESYGHNCSFLDIKPNRVQYNESFNMRLDETINKFKKILKLPLVIKRKTYQNQTDMIFKKEYWPMLGLSQELCYDKSYDLIIIGSDEIFNFAQKNGLGLALRQFGLELDAKSMISYAASFGHSTVEMLEKSGFKEIIKKGFDNIDDFSVRDGNSFDLVKYITNRTPVISLDPTLLYSFNKEIQPYCIDDNYILVYAYAGRMDNKEDIKQIREFACRKGLKLIASGFYQYWCDENVFPNPFEVLSLFKNARYIITDTFHGNVLSTKFNKQFCAFICNRKGMANNTNKVSYFLNQMQLENRVVRNISNIGNILDSTIDFNKINSIIETKRQESISYLEKWLVGCH